MPQLTFLQSVADKASRLLPCSFTEIVEETTSEVLTAPDYENIMFICDQTNARPDNAHEVVMAVRRRIDNANPKVKYFTVLLLDALIKNCYEDLHNEVADTPALQNCLVDIACLTPIQDGELEAKKAALQLILNMSYWFIGATEDKTKMLSKLADEVRQKTSPLAFEDIEADAAFQLKRAPTNRRRAANATTSNQQQAAAHRVSRNQNHNPSSSSSFTAGSHGHGRTSRPSSGGGGSPAPVRVVDAIPVFQYTEQEISGMLDSCMLLSEMINAAEEEKRSVMGDEIVTSIAVQVRRDHRKLAILLSSGAQMDNLDVLLSVADSQMAIVQRLSDLVARDGQRLRDVASIGADEDDAAAAAIEHSSRREANPAQITRNNPSNATPEEHMSGQEQPQQHEHKHKPRQGDLDNDHCPPPLPIPAPGHRATDGHQSTAVAAASPSTVAVTAVVDAQQQQQPKKPTQDLDDFFGGPTSSSSSHPSSAPPVSSTPHSSAVPTANTVSVATAESNVVTTTTSSPSEATTLHSAGTTAATSNNNNNNNTTTHNAAPLNTDFFDEGNNAPSAGVNAKPLGSLNNNATTEGGDDEFDAFLSSRLK